MYLVHNLNPVVWAAFVKQNPRGNIFHTPEMYKVFERTNNYKPSLWAVTDNQEQVLALFIPIEITLNQRFRRLTTRAVSFGSILCEESLDGNDALAFLLQSYNKEVDGKSIFTELRNLSNLEVFQSVLLKHHYEYEEHLNYLIDLARTPDEILQSFGKRTRKHIRRGLRRCSIFVEEVTTLEGLDASYRLIKSTYDAARIPLSDRSLFEAAFDLLAPLGMVRFTIAKKGKIPVSTSLELLYKDTVYGWYSGMDRNYRSYMPSEMIMWSVLEWGSINGFQVYDFGGAGKPGEKFGVRDFKAKFGGKIVNYGRNRCIHSHLLFQLSSFGFKVYNKLPKRFNQVLTVNNLG